MSMIFCYILFGIMLQGFGSYMYVWKYLFNLVDVSVNLQFYIDIVCIVEDNGIVFGFVVDGLYINEKLILYFFNCFELILLLFVLVMVMKKIGLVGMLLIFYSDLFIVVCQFVLLDLFSGGCVGWNVVILLLEGFGCNYGCFYLEYVLCYQIVDEYLEVVQGLWDLWDDDVFVCECDSGMFFVLEKFCWFDYKGCFFQVEGLFNIQCLLQG